MAYNANLNMYTKRRPNHVEVLNEYNVGNREISLNLNKSFPSLSKPLKDGEFTYKDEELIEYLLGTKVLMSSNIAHINFFLYDYVCDFLTDYEIGTNVLNEIDLLAKSVEGELVSDINGHILKYFKLGSEYKMEVIDKSFKLIDKTLSNLGISYKLIYIPTPCIPDYIHTESISSPAVYGYNFTEFENKYLHKFELNSNNVEKIDVLHCQDEIDYLSSKYYEDIFRVKSIIKSINPLIEVGLGIDYYLHIGNYCHDDLLLLDKNLYSNFQEAIVTNPLLNYPFMDFLYVDNLNYDYTISSNGNDTLALVDIRTINERINLVAEKYSYPLDKIEIGFLDVYGDDYNNRKYSFLLPLKENLEFRANTYDILNIMLYEDILRFNLTNQNNVTYKLDTKNTASYIAERKTSILSYIGKIYIKDTFNMNVFDEDKYNSYLLVGIIEGLFEET